MRRVEKLTTEQLQKTLQRILKARILSSAERKELNSILFKATIEDGLYYYSDGSFARIKEIFNDAQTRNDPMKKWNEQVNNEAIRLIKEMKKEESFGNRRNNW